MDPQNSGPDRILCCNLEVFMIEFSIFVAGLCCSMQSSVATCFYVLLLRFLRDRVSLVVTVFFSSAYSFCHDNLMCGSLNSYVTTSTILLR